MADYTASEAVVLPVFGSVNPMDGRNNQPGSRAEGTVGGLGAPVSVTRYYKRAWRTETPGYVEWDTTDPLGAYGGGGTLYPALGAVVYTRME